MFFFFKEAGHRRLVLIWWCIASSLSCVGRAREITWTYCGPWQFLPSLASLICHIALQRTPMVQSKISLGHTLGDEIHLLTGVSDRYSLSDRFHERNSSCPADLLRRVLLVLEINAVVNTEVEEQLHSVINRSNYSFNMMLPGNHLFMMRLKMHMCSYWT